MNGSYRLIFAMPRARTRVRVVARESSTTGSVTVRSSLFVGFEEDSASSSSSDSCRARFMGRLGVACT